MTKQTDKHAESKTPASPIFTADFDHVTPTRTTAFKKGQPVPAAALAAAKAAGKVSDGGEG